MIKTIDDLLLWSNDSGISIAQITARAIIHHEPIPEGFPQPEIYWPKVHYSDQDRIIVGWVNHLWFFRVSLSTAEESNNQFSRILSSAASSFRTPVDKKVEVERHAVVEDVLIAGLSEFNDDIMLLNYIPPKTVPNPNGRGRGRLEGQPPELRILNRETLEDESVDEITLNSSAALGSSIYMTN
ncbi:unnamed protein product [Ambrosiozyma monospora]|uniref:Unnamed protein product n=1 Tax=Ambrosiozyma monospora TaxID=43982 RepID=A0A9W6T6W7_AMBMO|nr:unnamed protein product [Ambrosiozyma monospora]